MTILGKQKTGQPGFIGTIVPNGDVVTTNWEDEGGATSDLFDSVDDSSDSTYNITDGILMAFCGGSEVTRNIRWAFENPSTNPSGVESTIVYVRARISGVGADPTVTMQLDAWDGTTYKFAESSTHTLTTSWAWYAWVWTTAERVVFADLGWSGFRLDCDFTICEDTGDWVYVEISQVYVDFSA